MRRFDDSPGRIKTLVAFCTLISAASGACAVAPRRVAQPDPGEPIASRLIAWLEGSFDSTEQAAADADFLPITLTSCRVSAPGLGPRVLYLEQARAGKPPYRQRLYVIEPGDAQTARSRVFEPASPAVASGLVGHCASKTPTDIRAEDFTERAGCTVTMRWSVDHFEGRTAETTWNGTAFVPDPSGNRCASSLRGATYATTQVALFRDQLRSWDRGFDANHTQVWGAEKGGYVFVRRSPLTDAEWSTR